MTTAASSTKDSGAEAPAPSSRLSSSISFYRYLRGRAFLFGSRSVSVDGVGRGSVFIECVDFLMSGSRTPATSRSPAGAPDAAMEADA